MAALREIGNLAARCLRTGLKFLNLFLFGGIVGTVSADLAASFFLLPPATKRCVAEAVLFGLVLKDTELVIVAAERFFAAFVFDVVLSNNNTLDPGLAAFLAIKADLKLGTTLITALLFFDNTD